MSKKHKPGRPTPITAMELRPRIERTRTEGRFQQALELVKTLYHAEPTPGHLELLKDTYLQRALQLRSQGYARDAATVLDVAARHDDKNTAWLTRLAEELGHCGDAVKQLAVLNRLKSLGVVTNDQTMYAGVADQSFVNEKNGRDSLPAPLREDHDRIVQAFEQVEAGQDDAARETLQGVGMKSPFLEWKLLLRGLQAYYANDDDRARENWQRLDPKRVPARLAAPFRAHIDRAYRDAQSPQTKSTLAQQLNWMQGDTPDALLKALREGVSNSETLAGAFRAAEGLLPHLKQHRPAAVGRLATCLYWNMLRYGPDELPRYRRVFGPPADDPDFHRLSAMAMGNGGALADAHTHWKQYEAWIATRPDLWPGEQGTLARALVWQHMAENAASVPSADAAKKLPRFLRDLGGMPKPLKPTAEECFAQSLKLAPQVVETHEGLFYHLLEAGKQEKAIKAGQDLIARFPDHVATLEELATLHLKRKEHDAARVLLEQAIKHNPLDRKLRQSLMMAHLRHARDLATKGEFPDARKHFESAVTFAEGVSDITIHTTWACAEVKAGDQARADELLAKARTNSPGELLITYVQLVETNRMGLGNTLKTRLTKAFNKEIEEPPTADLAMNLVGYAVTLVAGNVEYYGQATHTKKIVAYAAKVAPKDYTEQQLRYLIPSLVGVNAGVRMLTNLFHFAARQYPDNPFFPYYNAVYLMGDDPEETRNVWQIDSLLQTAEQLARKRPREEPGLSAILDDIHRRRKMIQALNPFLGMFGGGFGGGGPFGDIFGFGGEEDDY